MRTFLFLAAFFSLSACDDGIHTDPDGSDSVVYIEGSACTINMNPTRALNGDRVESFAHDFSFCMSKHNEFYPVPGYMPVGFVQDLPEVTTVTSEQAGTVKED